MTINLPKTLQGNQIWSNIINLFGYVLILFGAVSTVLPFIWMFLSSFKSNSDIAAIPLRWLPIEWIPENYSAVWDTMPFSRFYLNSIIIACSQTLGVLITSSMAAYSFSRIKFFGHEVLFMLFLGTIMIPGWVTIIPVFIIIKELRWLGTYQGLIVPGLTSAMGTFLLRQFFLSVPKDLEDATFIDGANRFQIYSQLILPLAKPALLTVGLMTFMGSWNSLTWPLIIAQKEEMQTLPLAISRLALFGNWAVTVEWGSIMAATLLSVLPILIIYAFLQNFFIRGIALSGMR